MRTCGVFAQENAKVFGQEAVDGVGVGEDSDLAVQAAGVGGEVGVHLFELGEDLPGVAEQRFAGRRRRQAAGVAGKERHAEGRFELRQPVAGRGGGEMHRLGGAGQAAGIGNRGDQPQVGEIVAHGFVHNECLLGIIPIVATANAVFNGILKTFPELALEKSNAYGAGLALLAALGFSLKAIFVKLAYPYGVDAITLLALRMGFALPVFLWVGLAGQKAGANLTRGDWGWLVALGCLGYYGASILDFWGLQYISAGLERLILFTYPTLTLLIGVLFQGKAFTLRKRRRGAVLRRHRLRLRARPRPGRRARACWIGGALVFASSVSYALYLSGSATMITRLGAMRFSALAMLVSSAVTLLHFSHRTRLGLYPAAAGLWLGAGDGGVRHHRPGLCPVGGDPPHRRRAGLAIRHGRADADHSLRLVAARRAYFAGADDRRRCWLSLGI
jgi:drug/metabolite transporter (DMT)-like permease